MNGAQLKGIVMLHAPLGKQHAPVGHKPGVQTEPGPTKTPLHWELVEMTHPELVQHAPGQGVTGKQVEPLPW